MANAYSTFKIWIYDATGATSEDNLPVITYYQVFILNGHLIIDGAAIEENAFIKNEGKSIYNLNARDLNFQIPSNISLDDIVVRIGTDGGNLGDGISDDYSINISQNKLAQIVKDIKNNSKLNLELLGNPVLNNLDFVLSKGNIDFSDLDVIVLDNTGRIVKKIYNGNLSSGEKRFSLDISAFPVGNYYLCVTTNTKEKFIKKFIKY